MASLPLILLQPFRITLQQTLPQWLLRKEEVIKKVSVNPRIAQGLPSVGQRGLALNLRHAEGGEGPAGKGGEDVLLHGHLLVHADDAEGLVTGPRADGHFLNDALDVLEAGIAQQGLERPGQPRVHVELGKGGVGEVVAVLDGVVVGHGAVVA